MPSSSSHGTAAPPVLRTRLVCSSSSLLDATLVDYVSHRVVYALFTDPSTHTTMITRPDAERVAWVQWATSPSQQPTILFEGDTVPINASETLFSSSVLGHTRKFRAAGYAESFKWKKVNSGWQCFTPSRALLASLKQHTSGGMSLELYHHDSRPFTGSSAGSDGGRSISPEESLQDTLVLTSLLLTTPPSGDVSTSLVAAAAVAAFAMGSSTASAISIRKRASAPGLRSKSSRSEFTPTSSYSSTISKASSSTSFSTSAPTATSLCNKHIICNPHCTSTAAMTSTKSLPVPPKPTLLGLGSDEFSPRRAFEIERESPPSPTIITRNATAQKYSSRTGYSYEYGRGTTVQPLPIPRGEEDSFEEAYYPPLVVPDADPRTSWNAQLDAKARMFDSTEKLRTAALAV